MKRILLIATLFVILASSIGIADYASTRVYFNVPTTNTFTIALPEDYSPVSITGASEATATGTDWISFNFSTAPQGFVEPQVLGAVANVQDNANNKPIMYIDNTGNNNYTLTVYINETMPTSLDYGINASTTPLTGCGTAVITYFNITANAQNLVTNFGKDSCFLNVTMWGFVNTNIGGEFQTNQITNTSV